MSSWTIFLDKAAALSQMLRSDRYIEFLKRSIDLRDQ